MGEKKMYFLGIDVGTSSVKIILMDRNGTSIFTSSRQYPLYHPHVGWAEQDPEDWWIGVKEGIREILKKSEVPAEAIKAVGLSGQMHGMVALDKNDRVLMPAILWCDQRTQEECDYLNNTIGVSLLTKYTGNKALTGFTAPKILWVKKHKKNIFDKIAHILLPKDFIRFKLTGEYATDVSDASGTLLFDVENKKWSQKMLEIVGLSERVLPECYESNEVTGKISCWAAAETGLVAGTPVVGGGGDQACGAVGTGTVESGIISVALGTSGVVFACQDSYSVDEESRLHSFCHANGKWHVMGVMLSAASCLKWWVENVTSFGSKNSYDLLLEEAGKSSPGSNGIIFLPYLMGERTPYNDPDAKGAFIGLNITHRRGDLTRAILEGVAFGLKDSLEIIKEMHIPIKSARVNGGGATSTLWRQILANVFDLRVDVVNSTEGPAFGAAILAAVGAGAFRDVNEACRSIIKTMDSVFPDEAEVNLYNDIYKIYNNLYKNLNKSFENISKIFKR